MSILSFNFLLYTICGLWRPIEWSSKWSKLLYSVFTFTTMYLIACLSLTNLLFVIFVAENIDEFSLSSPIFFSSITVIFKTIAMIIYRDQIINLIKTLEEEPCKPCNEDETAIQIKFDYTIRSYSIYYAILCTFSVTGGLTAGVFKILKRQFPFNIWVPWDCTSYLLFLFTSIQVIVAITVATVINVATETTVLGFCLQVCAQFEILKHRLQRIVKDRKEEMSLKRSLYNASHKMNTLSKHICHHLCIIRLAERINNVYRYVIFIQFFVSILVLCLIVYYLSSHVTVVDIATWIGFVFSMFVQIFVYCWAGNEIILQSTGLGEAVYHVDWVLMTLSELKDLMIIMKRSTRPIKITSSFLVTLSLESYTNLLKATFSTFNLLKQL
ncbi:odorant receptor 13a [Monomorium pharaonis]|uniref:odorant receptor 13a n=1 Tax=Monomorium pharaonis TaxID=307658 RepID=UPI00063F9BA1|nr:odorant receptor 13a [Monomorium pharaonis]